MVGLLRKNILKSYYICFFCIYIYICFIYLFLGESLTYHDWANFTTKDRNNNEAMSENCGELYSGAWWYAYKCGYSNLNGVYGSTNARKGINWYHWKGFRVPLTGTRMMVKRKP